MSYHTIVAAALLMFCLQIGAAPVIGMTTPGREYLRPEPVRLTSVHAFEIALATESGRKHFGGAGSVAGPGEPTTSRAGAIGIAQVMPGTAPEAAKLAGLKWDERRYRLDPEYNRALGQAYFDKQLREFRDVAKAYAAYNAGPGAVRRAIRQAREEGGDWLALLPRETRDYVAKNMKALRELMVAAAG